MVAHTFYQGEYPVLPLDDATHGGFNVNVRVHLWAPSAGSGVLTVNGGWQAQGVNVTVPVSWLAGDSNVTATLTVRYQYAHARLRSPTMSLRISQVLADVRCLFL